MVYATAWTHGASCTINICPLAYDQQNILIRELMGLKQVNENEIDQLFHDVERICDLYIKAGSEEDQNLNKWAEACIMQEFSIKLLALTFFSQGVNVQCTKKGRNRQ